MEISRLYRYLMDQSGSEYVLSVEDLNLSQDIRDWLGTVPTGALRVPKAGASLRLEGDRLMLAGDMRAKWEIEDLQAANLQLVFITTSMWRDAEGCLFVEAEGKGELQDDAAEVMSITVKKWANEDVGWTVHPNGAATASPLAIMQMANGVLFGKLELPSGLMQFEARIPLTSEEFSLRFFPGTDYRPRMALQRRFPDLSWDLLPGIVALKAIRLKVDFREGGLGLLVEGECKLGAVEVVVATSIVPEGTWTLGIRPASGDRFPGIVALISAFVGGYDASSDLAALQIAPQQFDLALKHLQLAADPFKGRFIGLDMVSVVTLFGYDFGVRLQLPELAFGGYLSKETPIRLKEFAVKNNLPSDFIPETLVIAELEVQANLRRRYARCACFIEADWAIGPFTLKDVNFVANITHTAESGLAVSADLQASFAFAKGKVQVGSEIDTTSGITLWGEYESKEPLTLPVLAAALGKDFNVELPEIMQKMGLVSLETSITLGTTNEYTFRCVGTFPLNEVKCRAEMGLVLSYAESKWNIALDGEIRLGRILLGATLKLGSTNMLVLKAEDVDLESLIKLFVPDFVWSPDLPQLRCEKVSLEYNHDTGSFTLDTTTVMDWENPLGFKGKTSTKFIVNITRTGATSPKDRKVKATFGLDMTGSLQIAENLLLEGINLSLGYETGKSWELGGGLKAKIWEHSINLKGKMSPSTKDFMVEAELGGKDETLLEIPGVVKFRASSFSLTRKTEGKNVKWEFLAKSGLDLVDILVLNGDLKVESSGQTFKLELQLDEGSKIDLPLVPQGISPQEIRLVIGAPKFSVIKNEKGWRLEAGCTLKLTGMPEGIYARNIIPREINTTLGISKEGVNLTVEPLTGLIDIDLPNFKVGTTEIKMSDLGKAKAQVTKLSLTLGARSELALEFGLGLPTQLNHILFKKKESGEPNLKLFKVFDPEKPSESLVKFTFTVGNQGSDLGVSFVLNSSPIEKLEVKDGEWMFNLGPMGTIAITVPRFSLSSKGFSGKVGYRVVDDLKLPLTALKGLLKRSGAGAVADALPEAWPLMEIDFLNGKDVKIDALADWLGEQFRIVTGKPLDPKLIAAIKEFGKLSEEIRRVLIEKLPTDLQDYLRIRLPKSFSGEATITWDGGAEVKVDVDKDRPLRFLMPSMVGPVPALVGVTFKSFSLGAVLGGSLLSMGVNVRFDVFDMATIVAGLLIPGNEILPPSREVHRRIFIEDLYMLIVYQTYIPIPVPIFYTHLGVDSLGLEGIHLESHASFRRPGFDPKLIVRILAALKQFVQDENYALKPEELDSEMKLRFTLDDVYLELPKYLGGAVVGKKGNLVDLNSTDLLCKALTGIKFFSISDTISTSKLTDRKGSAAVALGPIAASAEYLLCTPQEFASGAYSLLNIPLEHKQDWLDLVGGAGKNDGFVAFLKTRVALDEGRLLSLETAFGVAMVKKVGFGTGLRFKGSVLTGFTMDLNGQIGYRAKPLSVYLAAGGGIGIPNVPNLVRFKGELAITSESVALAGDFELFKGQPFQIVGGLKGYWGKKGIYFEAGVSAALGVIVLAGASVKLKALEGDPERGLWMDATLLGAAVHFAMVDTPTSFKMDFTAKIPSHVDVTANLLIEKDGSKIEANLDITVLGFGLLHAEVRHGYSGGYFTITHLDLLIGRGTSISYEERVYVDGDFQLLPNDSPINMIGWIKGDCTKTELLVKGQVTSTAILGSIVSAGSLTMNRTGLLIVFSVFSIAAPEVLIKKEDKSIVFNLVVSLGILRFTPAFSIHEDGQSGTMTLGGGVGDLSLGGTVNLGAIGGGSFHINLIGIRLVGGSVKVEGSDFKLEGDINFVIFVLSLKGKIDQTGISLGGGVKFDITVFKIEFTFSLSNDKIHSTLEVTGLGVITSRVLVFRNQIALQGYWQDGWFKLYNYVGIGNAGYFETGFAAWSLPRDWPPFAAAMVDEGVPQDLLEGETVDILPIMESFLFHNPVDGTGPSMPYDFHSEAVSRTLYLTRCSGHSIRIDDSDPTRPDLIVLRRTVEVTATDRVDDFFSHLMGLAMDSGIEAGQLQEILPTATATLVNESMAPDNRKAQVTLESGVHGKKYAGELDFGNPMGFVEGLVGNWK